MWLLLNTSFFACNLIVFVFLYRAELYRLFQLLPQNYQVFIAFFLLSLKLRFQQWYGGVVEQIENGQYIVSLMINRKIVKLLIEPAENPPVSIEDDEDVDITEEALPYFRIKSVRVTPDLFFSDKLACRYSDGTTTEIINANQTLVEAM